MTRGGGAGGGAAGGARALRTAAAAGPGREHGPPAAAAAGGGAVAATPGRGPWPHSRGVAPPTREISSSESNGEGARPNDRRPRAPAQLARPPSPGASSQRGTMQPISASHPPDPGTSSDGTEAWGSTSSSPSFILGGIGHWPRPALLARPRHRHARRVRARASRFQSATSWQPLRVCCSATSSGPRPAEIPMASKAGFVDPRPAAQARLTPGLTALARRLAKGEPARRAPPMSPHTET